jgi:hypothetical protein
MSNNTLTVVETVNAVTVTPIKNTVTVSSVGVQGAKGDTGATGAAGATGAQGSSGVVTVNAPLTNAGTSSAANLSVSTGTTSAVGVLQLTDSVSSTSTTTAATANAVKTVSDVANLKFNIMQFRSSAYYVTPFPANTAITLGTNRTYYFPMWIPNTVTADRIQFTTSGSFSGTSSCRLGIYADNGGIPSTLILDAGTVSCTAASTQYAITISQSLTGGNFYWLAWNAQTGATVNSYLGFTESRANINYQTFRVSATLTGILGYEQAGVTGAFANASSPNPTGFGLGLAIRIA